MVEVLIVGAGPVGLNLAVCLSNLGINYRIIDKKPQATQTSNAIGVNPRTLEIWQTLGFANQALARGTNIKSSGWYDEGKLLNKIEFALVKSKYNFMLSLPQAETERLLNEQLEKMGKAIEWDTELISYTDNGNKIVAICSKKGREEKIEASWMIGCDGYRSAVRELSGISRTCHDLTQHFIMVDAQLNGNVPTDEFSISFHDDGVLFFFPMKDSIRVVAEISHDTAHKNVAVGSAQDTVIFNDILSKRFPGLSIKQIEWASSFYVHECLVDTYYKNHVVLCGDAAHTHSPAGGQGMNTGIQDTWNLSWKLAHIIRNEASEKLLESYQAERYQVGHEVLSRSGKITSIGATNNKMVQALRNFGISHLMGMDKVAAKFVNSIGQTDICYFKSKLVNHKAVTHNKVLRYQSDKIEWMLLTKYKVSAHGLPSYINIRHSDSDLLHKREFCLIRPDGYIATYANKIDEIQDFLRLNGFNL